MIVGLLAMVAGPLALGAGWVSQAGLRFSADRLRYLGFAYLAGCLGTGLLLFAWLSAGLPLPWFQWLPLALGALALVISARARRPIGAEAGAPALRGTAVGRCAFFLVAGACVLATVGRIADGNEVAIAGGDEAHIWARKAKEIHRAGGFNAAFREAIASDIYSPHKDYPLLNPLLQVFAFVHAGGIVDIENRVPIQLCTLALLLVLASAMRSRAGPGIAAILLFIVLSVSETRLSSYYAMADGMIALGLLAATDCVARLRDDPRRVDVHLLAIALAFLAWSKHEGSMLCLAIGVVSVPLGVFAALRRTATSRVRAWLPLLLPLAVAALQLGFNRHYELKSILMSGNPHGPLWSRVHDRFRELIGPYLDLLVDYGLTRSEITSLLPALTLVLLIASPRRLGALAGGAAWIVLLALVGYSIVYLSNDSPEGMTWHVTTSIRRVLFHLVPTAALSVAAATRTLLDDALRRGAPPRLD